MESCGLCDTARPSTIFATWTPFSAFVHRHECGHRVVPDDAEMARRGREHPAVEDERVPVGRGIVERDGAADPERVVALDVLADDLAGDLADAAVEQRIAELAVRVRDLREQRLAAH